MSCCQGARTATERAVLASAPSRPFARTQAEIINTLLRSKLRALLFKLLDFAHNQR